MSGPSSLGQGDEVENDTALSSVNTMPLPIRTTRVITDHNYTARRGSLVEISDSSDGSHDEGEVSANNIDIPQNNVNATLELRAMQQQIVNVDDLELQEDVIASGSQQTIQVENQQTEEAAVSSVTTPSPPKKRKRSSYGTTKTKNTPKLNSTTLADENSDDDDGCTCPICLDKWEMTGSHRLVALRCGHLFGESCIKRWLTESSKQSGTKVCPQCKAKSNNRDIRQLYAKRVRCVDRSEEQELRRELDSTRRKVHSLEMEISVLKMKDANSERRLSALEAENSYLKMTLCSRPLAGAGISGAIATTAVDNRSVEEFTPMKSYKLFLEHNILISRDEGCRVMAYSKKKCELFVSQKSVNNLFPGYGVRVIDASNFRPLQFLHLTAKELRDMSFNADEQIIACTSLESSAKLYDTRMRETTTVGPLSENKKFWACAMGDNFREYTLYLGAQQGSTSVVDIRFPNTSITCHEVVGDLSPVFSIAVMPRSEEFPFGGFCVGKLQSIWFYENSADEATMSTFRLDVEGPFLAMSFEPAQNLLILTTRKSMRYNESRFIVGKIKKIDAHVIFEPKSTFIGGKSTLVMTRGCQIAVQSNTLFTAFIQDAKQLALFDIRRQIRLQSLPVSDLILDTCPIYTARDTYVAALTSNKCRIYKLNET